MYPPGAPETEEAAVGKPQVRIFILGAPGRIVAASACLGAAHHAFPVYPLPLIFHWPRKSRSRNRRGAQAKPEAIKNNDSPKESAAEKTKEDEKPTYLPNVYQPPTPNPIERLRHTRSSPRAIWKSRRYTVPYTAQLTITGMQANYADVHAQFQHTLDPYSDVFFFFSPGFGFPSPDSFAGNGEPLLQIASPTEWGPCAPHATGE